MQWGFPGGCLVKNPPANAGDEGSIPRSGRCPKRGNSNVFQYSCLENSMDRQAWRATVHGVTNSQDIPSHYCMAKRRGKGGSSDRFPLLGLQNHYGQWLQPWNQKTISSWQESDDKPSQCVEKQRHYSADKSLHSQGHGLPSGHAWLWELDCKEGRMPKNWCLPTVVLEKTPESPLDSKEIKPVNLKGNQAGMFSRRTDTEAEAPVFWSSDTNRWLIGKVPGAGKDWGQEKRVAEDEMVGRHH